MPIRNLVFSFILTSIFCVACNVPTATTYSNSIPSPAATPKPNPSPSPSPSPSPTPSPTPSGLPNFAVLAVTFVPVQQAIPGTFSAGDVVNVIALIKNTGNAIAASLGTVELILSPQDPATQAPEGNFYVLDSQTPALAVGATTTVTVYQNFLLYPGFLGLKVIPDYDNSVATSSPNTGSASYNFNILPSPLPKLQSQLSLVSVPSGQTIENDCYGISNCVPSGQTQAGQIPISGTYTNQIVAGQAIQIMVTIYNPASIAVPSSTVEVFMDSNSATPQYIAVPAIAAGTSVNVSVPTHWTPTLGQHTWTSLADVAAPGNAQDPNNQPDGVSNGSKINISVNP